MSWSLSWSFCYGLILKHKHHFVPRFYLQAFRSAPRRIHLYNLKCALPVANASLRDQCYRSKFYGSDDGAENTIAQLEDWISPALREVKAKNRLPELTSDNHQRLLAFAAMQILRTPKVADRLNRITDKMIKQMLAKSSLPDGLNIEEARIGYEDPVLVSLSHLGDVLHWISDLKAHLLVAPHNSFLTSDNPAFKYNQYCEEVQWQGVTGAASGGLQYFIPLSPQHELILYDEGVYPGFPRSNQLSWI